jgi:hypothetical protein
MPNTDETADSTQPQPRQSRFTITHENGSIVEGTVTTTIVTDPKLLDHDDWASFDEIRTDMMERIKERRKASAPGTPFPANALRGLLGQWATYMVEGANVPPEFYYLSALTYLGHCLGASMHLGLPATRPQLYTLLIGPPSCGKGWAIERTRELYESLPELHRPNVCDKVNSAEGIATAIKSHGGDEDLLLSIDEFMTLLKKGAVDNSILLDEMLTLFEKTVYESNTAQKSVRLENIHLSLLSTIQQERWEETAGGLVASGFSSRLILVPHPTPLSAIPREGPPRDPAILEGFKQELTRRLVKYKTAGVLRRSEEAKANFDRWKATLPRTDETARLGTSIGLRLLVLVAVDFGKEEVDAEVVEVVTGLLGWQLGIKLGLTPSRGMKPLAECQNKIVSALRRGPRTLQELNKNLGLYAKYGTEWYRRQ